MGICQQFSGLHVTLIYIVTWTIFNDSVFRIYPPEIKCGNWTSPLSLMILRKKPRNRFGGFLAAFDYQRVYVSLSNHILGTVTSISLGPVQWEYLLVIYRYVKRSLLWTWDVVHRMLQLWQPQGNCVFKPGLRKPWVSNLATTRISDFQWVEYSKDDLANHDLVYRKNDL